MAVPIPTYIDIIATMMPHLDVSAAGDGSDYDSLVWQDGVAIPSKEALDLLVIEKAKVLQWRAIQEKRDFLRGNGLKIGTDWFHTDDSSRIQHLGLVLLGTNMPPGIMWKTMGGTFVLMTPTLANQIFVGIAMHDTLIFGLAEQKRATMLALKTLTEITQYDATPGWPETFVGTI
jgi:hypothetical protein